MTAVCRQGHISDESDYCSLCGAPIPAGAASPIPVPRSSFVKTSSPGLPAPPAAALAAAGVCPSCGEPREEPDARFCEVCRFDFLEKRPGPPPAAKAAAPRPAPAPAPAPAPTPFGAPAPVPAGGWELILAIDPSLDTEPDPDHPCPVDKPEMVLLVDKPDLLVGRHDETRAIHPEISLHDPGASRRHAKFVIDPDGGIALQDLASTNGTQVNAKDVPPGTRRRLKDGDSVTLGRWTRITVRGRP